MNPQDQRTIEQLLDQLAVKEHLGDPSHRYALRRSLCNSKYFEVHRASVVWERIISISIPTFAGGFVVILAVIAVNVGVFPINGINEIDGSQFVQSEELPIALLEDDISVGYTPNPRAFDISNISTISHSANFIRTQPKVVYAR